MKNSTFGFIGTGNMGGALALAAVKALGPGAVFLSGHSPEKAKALAAQTGAAVRSNEELAESCGFLFLGVKPQMMAGVLSSLSAILKGRTDRFVLVSMAAGLSIADIRKMAGKDYPVIRIMPNTPVSVGEGVVLYAVSDGVLPEETELFTNAMHLTGLLDRIPERLMDAGSAISGCGPAFVYLFLEALADGAVQCGLPRDKALKYAAMTAAGSAKLVLESGEHPGALKDAVCSPGGSTIAGVNTLEERAFRGAVMAAVRAAFLRTKELGK